jgi:hypothetical protein
LFFPDTLRNYQKKNNMCRKLCSWKRSEAGTQTQDYVAFDIYGVDNSQMPASSKQKLPYQEIAIP